MTEAAPGNPVPAIASLSPSSAAAGGAAFTLTVAGSGFVSSSTVFCFHTLNCSRSFRGCTTLR